LKPTQSDRCADIILVNAKTEYQYKPDRVEHLGLTYLAAVLRQQGWRPLVHDANFHGIDASDVAQFLLATSSYAIGFSVFLTNIGPTLKIIKKLRMAGDSRHISLGGHHATFNHREILLHVPELDAVVMGEGEVPTLGLIERVSKGAEWHSIPGIAYRTLSGGAAVNPCPPLIPDLDTLPFPDRTAYEDTMWEGKRATVVSSRGCYGKCSFCSIRAFYNLGAGPRWRCRSPDSVVTEIEELVRNYGVRHIDFADDNLIGGGRYGKKRARAIGQELLRRKLDVKFYFICRPNDVDPDLLGFLKEAGLQGVDIGVESWVPRQLSLYDKGLDLEDNFRAVEILQDLNLINRFYIIPSDPYATIDELLENLAVMERLGISKFQDSAVFNRLTVFKGSPIETQIRSDGLLRSPQNRFSFEGAFTYAYLHPDMEYLHILGDRIYQEFNTMGKRLKRALTMPECHELEHDFYRELYSVLRDTIFHLFKETALDCRGKDTAHHQDVPKWLTDALQTLEQQVSAIETWHEEGIFHRFSTVEVPLGKEKLIYPPLLLRNLAEKLENALIKEFKFDVRSSPDQLPNSRVRD
jgi:radical SAM superfamily enzyme YgiQ (UPF0313 family)